MQAPAWSLILLVVYVAVKLLIPSSICYLCFPVGLGMLGRFQKDFNIQELQKKRTPKSGDDLNVYPKSDERSSLIEAEAINGRGTPFSVWRLEAVHREENIQSCTITILLVL